MILWFILHVYRVNMTSLRLMYSWLSNIKQNVRINNKILFWVPQGFYHWSFLFCRIFYDLLYFSSNSVIANYVVDCNVFFLTFWNSGIASYIGDGILLFFIQLKQGSLILRKLLKSQSRKISVTLQHWKN